jgi:hypothetical protein
MGKDIERATVYTLTGLVVTALVATCITLWRRPQP